jgi:hypothetical protein
MGTHDQRWHPGACGCGIAPTSSERGRNLDVPPTIGTALAPFTCRPFRIAGDTPRRYVVRATAVDRIAFPWRAP